MRTIKDMCELLGLSHRTVRYYDYIDLLKPAAYTDAGYRLYDEMSVKRMIAIRLLTEVGYELSEIKLVLDDPEYDLEISLDKRSMDIEAQKDECKTKLELIRQIRTEGIDSIVQERYEYILFAG